MNDTLTRCVTDAGSTPARSTNFINKQCVMKLNKYQKSRLLEFEWDVLHNPVDQDNTRWVTVDSTRPQESVDKLKDVLGVADDNTQFKILVVATRIDK